MTLIGDVGGFNGAIVVFPTILLAGFSERMYRKAIAEDMPFKKTTSQKLSEENQDKIRRNQQILDRKSLMDEFSKIGR